MLLLVFQEIEVRSWDILGLRSAYIVQDVLLLNSTSTLRSIQAVGFLAIRDHTNDTSIGNCAVMTSVYDGLKI